MKRALLSALVLVLFSAALGAQAAKQLRVAVVEFDLVNSIGVDGAKAILAELLNDNLRTIGDYEMAERILLSKALDEQQLELTGIGDERKAAEIGKVYGVEAIATGLAMKVSGWIIVSSRLIDTATGEVLKGATVRFRSIGELKGKLEELAFYLSGYTPRQYRVAVFKREMGGRELGASVGGSVAKNGDNLDIMAPLAFKPAASIEYRDLPFEGSLSFSGTGDDYYSLRALGSAYLFADSRLALAIAWQMASDNLNYEQAAARDYSGEYRGTVSPSQVAYVGIGYRILPSLRFSALYGAVITAQRADYVNGQLQGLYEGSAFDNYHFFDTNFVLELEWRYKGIFAKLSSWSWGVGYSQISGPVHRDIGGGDFYCNSLELGYSFPLR